MESSRHPYRKFVFGSAARSGDGLYYTLTGARHGRPIRLQPAEFELARLFDGSRDAAAVRSAAFALLNAEIGAVDLERFANDLATGDLLAAGSHEPLPVPPQTDGEAANIGWNRGPRPGGAAPEAIVPSTLPGSLSGAGLPGSLTGLWGAFRGKVAPPRYQLGAGWLLWLGSLLNLPLIGTVTTLLLLALVAGAVTVMWTHRIDMGRDFLRLLNPATLVVTLIAGSYLVNLLSELACAAAIAQLTRSKPVFGILFGAALIPRFHTDTGGAAEAANRGSRLRIVAAAMAAQLMIFVIAVLLWLLFHNGHSLLPALSVALALIASLFFFIQLNPLSKRDGYRWLVQWYQSSDLREQALYALFGYQRPWNEARRLPTRVLVTYGMLSLLYTLWVVIWILLFPGAWLRSYYGGVGVAIVLILLAFGIYDSVRRAQASRGSIGATKVDLAPPARVDWLIIGALAVLALFPYRYEPSGTFTVMPNARADIRALTAGDVREVLAKEGDLVKAGQVIAKLSDDEEKSLIAISKANLIRLQSQLALARQGGKAEEVDAAKQEIATAAKRYEFSRAEANRLASAFAKKAVSEQDYQRALSIAEVNQQQLIEAQKHLGVVGSPARNEQLQAIEADIAREQAQLDFHMTQLDHTQIKAPIAGRIVSGSLRYAVGDYLERGKQLATVEDAGKLLVEIKVPETDVGDVHIGDRAFAKAWAFPNEAWPGSVQEISPAAEKSEYGKVVRVLMAIEQPDGRLKPEMTGYAKVSVATYPAVVAFTRPLIRFLRIEVWSWLP